MRKSKKSKNLSEALGSYRGIIAFIFSLSGVINILALTGAFYMLQIYDRALTSGSVPTLLALSALAIGLYLFQGVLDTIRSQILVRIGGQVDSVLAPLAHKVTIDMPRYGYSTSEAKERGRDVDVLRQFLSGPGPMALFDLPWMPLYFAFVYFLHPWLGLMIFAGAIVLGALTMLTEVMTRRLAQKSQEASLERMSIIDSHARNADVLKAMGIGGRAIDRFNEANAKHLKIQTKANDISGSFSGISKVLRMILQSAILGLGAYLTIIGELSAGSIIAASVASARALAPVDMAISQWKNVVAARRSYKRLGETMKAATAPEINVLLKDPVESLRVENVTVAAPGTGAVVLSEVSFELRAGQALGLIGPSGGGKSSLAKALTGVWPLVRGAVRFDGAELSQWPADAIGRHLGYIPQDVSLLTGTVAENICRFDPEPDSEKILKAARSAGVHDLIVRLPDGYETQLGPHGTSLSGGQRQRIALARALYGEPFLVVLDEPNSNLDSDGESALTKAIKEVRDDGRIAIVIAHRPSALAAVDMVGIIQNGRMSAFGPKEEVMQSMMKSVPSPSQGGKEAAQRVAQKVTQTVASNNATGKGDPKWTRQTA